MATVSVVIGTYNRAAMVREAILAALGQSRPPEEVVVSDDASSDGTFAMLTEMAALEPRLKIFKQETNSGGVGNWNHAMKHARGDFVALCCDDDGFLPDHLEASLAYLQEHPEAGLVHSGFIDAIETAAGGRMEPRRFRSPRPLTVSAKNLMSYLTRYYDWPVHPSTIVMRREVWLRVGEFNAAYQLTDTDWFARASERCNVVLLPRHGVYNRRHGGNWSNRIGSAAMQREIFEIVEAAIARRYPDGLRRAGWRALWRANVRLRLALTLRRRVQTGHAAAAFALWQGLVSGTGRRLPQWLERWGSVIIRRSCRAIAAQPPGVSPL